MIRPTVLTASLWLALAAVARAESDAGEAPSVNEFDRVQVTATRAERAIVDVPSTVTVIDRERLDRELVRDLKDLFRYEPGISVTSNMARFGLGDIRIRGLGGNRVRIETDGIAMPDSFAIGAFSNANRNFTDLDTLKRVEIVRGPGSALYGSDALGGVVAFVTKDPSDYLAPGRDAYFGLKLGYWGESQTLFGGATAAFGGERWSGLVVADHRQGQETGNRGDTGGSGATRTRPNPQSSDGRSVLTKLVYAPDARQRFRLTVEGTEDQVDTDVLSELGETSPGRGAPPVRVLSQTGNDHQTRARVSLAHEIDGLENGFADAVEWQVYRQDSETTQRTREERATVANGAGINPTLREREFNFDQRLYGVEATLHKDFVTGTARHALTYGFEYTRTETRQKRDGRATNLVTGATTNVISPDTFPVRDFPVNTTQVAALFVQDEIAFAGDAFRLVPGLRVDRYELEPETDAIFVADNPEVAPARLTKTSVSPKLGMVWKFADPWSLFAGYQHGFRAPPYNDVNVGFTNLQFGYTAIPNPDLKPETSDGLELGLRYAGTALFAELAGYYNRYDDFIESLAVVSRPPQTPLIVFQSRNVSEATIRGIELRGGADFGAISDALAGWTLRAAAAWSKGRDETDDVPLASVDPLRASVGLMYDRETWGLELAGRFARRKTALADPEQFAPPGYGVFDLLAHWEFAPGAKLDVGLFNLTDRKYWDWADVTGVAATAPALDRYTRPGRSLAVSMAFAW